ncbi:MAG: DUF58 domain-containing protein [Eubacterium sp.]|nr:DUF58 domain-containing protein [Eubacterium sp.]
MHLILIVGMIGIIYIIQERLYRKYWKKGLRTSLCFSKEFMECGEEAELIEEIENDKALPLPVFHFKFAVDRSLIFDDMENSVVTDYYHRNDVFTVMGHQKIKRTLTFRGYERGHFQVENVNVMVRDFFMARLFAMNRKEDTGIYVFPKKLDVKRLRSITRGRIGEMEARRSLIEDPLSFRGLRDYQSMDPYRSINWKQSARTGQWKVNLYDATQDAEVRILLNLDTDTMIRTDRLLEESISLVSTLARVYLGKKERVMVWSNGLTKDGEPLTEPGMGSELSHGITIDKYLTMIRKSEGKDAFLDYLEKEAKHASSSTLYLVVSPYYKEDMLERLDVLRKSDAAVLCVVPYYDMIGFEPRRSYLAGWEVKEFED